VVVDGALWFGYGERFWRQNKNVWLCAVLFLLRP
jgi:hypothetical protein